MEIDLELTEVGKWNRYLIGHFLDGKMAYPLIVSTARNQWKDLFVAVKPDVAGFYLFEFKNEQAKMQVLEGRPYFFSQKYLVLKDWHRMMKPAQDQPTRIPAWVKLQDLPFELWNQDCLSRVASTTGKPLHVDQATAKSARQPGLLNTKSTKARICIEISAEQDLPNEVRVIVDGESVVVPIEYQVLPPMCTTCHVFGHSSTKCAKSTSSSSIPQQPAKQEWVQVQHGKFKGAQAPINYQKPGLPLSIPISLGSQQVCVLVWNPNPIAEEHSDSEDELIEVLEGVVSSNKEADSLTQHLNPTVPSVLGASEIVEADGSSKLSVTDPGTTVQTVQDHFSGEGATINQPSEARYQLSPKPPDIQSARAELIVNQPLSKSALKRMRKQLKEQSQCSLISEG